MGTPDWGPYSAGMVGVLVATNLTSGTQFSAAVSERYWYHTNGSVQNQIGNEHGNVWSAMFDQQVDVINGTTLELGTDARLHVTKFPPGTSVNEALHVNCGSSGLERPGAQIISYASTNYWEASENNFAINPDGTISPLVCETVGCYFRRDFVLGWGLYRWAPCHTPTSRMAVTIENASDPSATKFYFTPTVPFPPQPPPSPPNPPAYPPCADILHLVTTATGQGQHGCNGPGSTCTCAFIVQHWGSGVGGTAYCERPIRESISHLWANGWNEVNEAYGNAPISMLCPGTCAGFHTGSCAPPAPPAPPPSPALPPFAPCSDMLPDIATSSMQWWCGESTPGGGCTCSFILQHWRGSASAAEYCDRLISETLGHMFNPYGSAPSGRISSICQATCAGYFRGPCAPPAPPAPPPSPALPPFAPCSNRLPDIAPYPSCEGNPCTCEYIFEKWREQDSHSQYCDRHVSTRLSHLFSPPSSAPDEPIYTICAAYCAYHGKGACSPGAPFPPPVPPPPPFPPCTD
jgi:hypothetical protein